MLTAEQQKHDEALRVQMAKQKQLQKMIEITGLVMNGIGILCMTLGGAFTGAAACGAGVGAGAAGGAFIAFGLSVFVMGVLLAIK